MTTNKYSEPNKALEDLYKNLYLNPQPITESVATDEDSDVLEDEGDDGAGIGEAEFDQLFESILGDDVLNEEFDAQTEVDPSADPQVSPQDDLSEFDDEGGEEGGEEESISIPASQLRPLFDLLKAHFDAEGGEEDMGGEEDIMPADDENNFSNDELPTESVAPTAGKKLFDAKTTKFLARTNPKKPANLKTVQDKNPKKHSKKSSLLKAGDKNWV